MDIRVDLKMRIFFIFFISSIRLLYLSCYSFRIVIFSIWIFLFSVFPFSYPGQKFIRFLFSLWPLKTDNVIYSTGFHLFVCERNDGELIKRWKFFMSFLQKELEMWLLCGCGLWRQKKFQICFFLYRKTCRSSFLVGTLSISFFLSFMHHAWSWSLIVSPKWRSWCPSLIKDPAPLPLLFTPIGFSVMAPLPLSLLIMARNSSWISCITCNG